MLAFITDRELVYLRVVSFEDLTIVMYKRNYNTD